MTSEPPLWGTPDDATPPGQSYGSPAGSAGNPAYGSPTPGSGRPGSAPGDPLQADTVIVTRQSGFLSPGGYALLSPDGDVLGSVQQESSAAGWLLGGAASATFRIFDAYDQELGSMLRPGTLGRSQFVVADHRGTEVGTIEQENAFLAPQFLLTTAEGLVMRLTGGQFGSGQWQLVDGLDESVLMGQLFWESGGLSGMLGGQDQFAVQLSPQLTGGHRLLALMAAVCLEYVRHSKKNR